MNKVYLGILKEKQMVIGQIDDLEKDKNNSNIDKAYFLQFLNEVVEKDENNNDIIKRKAGFYIIPIFAPITNFGVTVKKEGIISIIEAPQTFKEFYFNYINDENNKLPEFNDDEKFEININEIQE
jgi:hypothetical protein